MNRAPSHPTPPSLPGAPAALAPLDAAVRAYRAGRTDVAVGVVIDGVRDADLPVSHLFRQGRSLTAFDRRVLTEARGSVLDVGAGVGALSGPLQNRGHSVTALEILPAAIEALRERHIAEIVPGDLWSFAPGPRRWDTVLLLTNGTTLAGTLARLPEFLEHVGGWVARPGGQLLVDSTPLGDEDEALEDGRYPGEAHYQLDFQGTRGPPFPQLFVDESTLRRAARAIRWRMEVLDRRARGPYLARLAPCP